MRELRFVDLSAEGSHVILMGKDGQQYRLAIDERLVAAVRRDRSRIGQIEIEREGALRPRDIQARIRAGATAEEVASLSGLPLERVRRFEGPVLTERAWVADQARSTELRRPGFTTTLNGLVNRALEDHGVNPADLRWDSWRRDDGRWTVQLLVPAGSSGEAEAQWVYDGLARTLGWENDLARALTEGEEFDLGVAASRPRLVSVPVVDADEESEGDEDFEDLEDLEDIELDDDLEDADDFADESGEASGDRSEELVDELVEDPYEQLGETVSETVSGEPAEDVQDDAEHPGAQIIDLTEEFARDEANEDLAVDGIDDVEDFEEEATDGEFEAELAEAEGRVESEEEPDQAPAVVPQTNVPTQSSLEDFLSEEDLGSPARTPEPSPARTPEQAPEPTPEPGNTSKTKRASVPSWDDILFGTKPISD